MKRAIIIGATSGIGMEVARLLLAQGWRIGIAGRRKENLQELKVLAPRSVFTQVMDINYPDATARLEALIRKVGGMDLYFHSSGIGFQNPELTEDTELKTVQTNAEGFTRMVTAAFRYFREQKQSGQIAVISSVAGTKGIGVAPAYSATKRFQSNYIEALAQLARQQKLDISFTDIRPGFVATELLGSKPYPMLMQPEKVARKIVNAVKKKKRVKIIDGRYRALVFFWRLIPRWLWERMTVKN